MLNFRQDEAAAVAESTRAMLATYDDAIGAAASLTLAFLTASRNSNMTASESQEVVRAIHESAGNVLAGRAGAVSAVDLLIALQRKSNHAESDFGCPTVVRWAVMGEGRRLRVAAAA